MGDLFSLYLRGTYVEEKVQVHTNPVSSAYVNWLIQVINQTGRD